MTTAYLAAEDYEADLDEEFRLAGVVVNARARAAADQREPAGPRGVGGQHLVGGGADRGHLDRARRPGAARTASATGPCTRTTLRGRAELIADKLPHVSARPLELGEVAPDAPLGSWTLLERDVVLAATDCAVPFPNGVPQFVEDRHGPPSRAYLKLWEAFARLRRQPGPGDRCLDLGAAPGGWTWLLARSGAEVVAVDKAPLDDEVAALRQRDLGRRGRRSRWTRPSSGRSTGGAATSSPTPTGCTSW